MHLLRLASFALVATALTPACSPSSGQRVTMADAFDVDLFGPHVDDLHSPYVAGSQFTVQVEAHDGSDTTGWQLRSSNPQIVAIGAPQTPPQAQPSFSVGVTTEVAGSATLDVLDAKGNVVDSHVVTVAVPDTVQLYAHGLLLAGEPDDQARVSVARVVSGGTATFLVRYFKGSVELCGSGALSPSATGVASATTIQSSLAVSRDWLAVGAASPGSGQVQLVVGGQTVGALPVTAVDPSAIARVGLAPQDASSAKDGQSLYVFGRAFDTAGNDLYGGSFQWSMDGTSAGGGVAGEPSDVLTYQYRTGSSDPVQASIDALSATTTVHAQGGSAQVGSSASVGCSIGGAPGAALGGGTTAATGLVALVLAAMRRRRSAARRTRW